MGLLDQLEFLAGGALQHGADGGAVPVEQQSSVSQALISSLAEHPGGVGGLLDSFRQNGMGGHVDSWVNSEPGQGTPQQLSPQQVQQGVPSSLLGSIAQRSGLPPQVVNMALATVLPLIMQHLTPNGQVPEQSQLGGLAQGIAFEVRITETCAAGSHRRCPTRRTLNRRDMADLEQLKQKYAPVVATIESFKDDGAAVEDESLDGDKLHLKATVPSQVVLNRVWDSIKQVDLQFADLHHEITAAGTDQKYTIKAGDNLSKVSKHFYGSPNHYDKIAQASGIDNPDHIKAGQEVTIPVLG